MCLCTAPSDISRPKRVQLIGPSLQNDARIPVLVASVWPISCLVLRRAVSPRPESGLYVIQKSLAMNLCTGNETRRRVNIPCSRFGLHWSGRGEVVALYEYALKDTFKCTVRILGLYILYCNCSCSLVRQVVVVVAATSGT
jgi:hypothetical protein